MSFHTSLARLLVVLAVSIGGVQTVTAAQAVTGGGSLAQGPGVATPVVQGKDASVSDTDNTLKGWRLVPLGCAIMLVIALRRNRPSA